ncbi:hypothetical protein L6270_05300 [Candidatus Parcubacteria bacterium]|nr:hypothetical protein [Patescibacteria group bacterium]MBU4309376.1 hypothetical protein [Patescibacteria group bacterium]MBU4432095.1 hypothetical protein [Patescibacteria group bacterium]MBU4577737.1 hypothetical protein [Patescibacteria group bacterium]MCG2697422.1 hypothetical protein [Candidatus Parcubacteria bacterium]
MVVKKTACRSCKPKVGEKNEIKDVVTEKINEGIVQIEKLVKLAKDKYAKTDEKTKHQVLAGVAGAAAVLGTIIGINAIKKKK